MQIQVEALDRSGLLSRRHPRAVASTTSTSSRRPSRPSNDRLALSRFVFEMGDTTHLDRVLNAVRRIDAVYDVYRVSAG